MADTRTAEQAKRKAQALFNKSKADDDKAAAMRDLHKAAVAEAAKTARLRALRLAKEAADAAAPKVAKVKVARAAKPKPGAPQADR